MKTTVQLPHTSYPIWIEKHAIEKCDSLLNLNRKIAIITDSGVPKKWVHLIEKQCPTSFVYTLPQGENSKCFNQYQAILTACIQQEMTRKDAIIAIGGGVVGDLAGFVAATYMRGIDFYNIPTTVLSQVDSSVGGKVAIDVEGYKNIVGAFWQPKAVIIDPQVLSTLPKRQINNGLVEALKSGLIRDKELVDCFKQETWDLENIITRSILVKKDVVQQDEKENGLRQILNFGHTIGHAIESAYGLDTYYHGECVAMGMLFFLDNPQLKQEVLDIYKRMELPEVPDYDIDVLMDYIRHDKKSAGDTISTIHVEKAGQCTIEKESLEQIRIYLERGPL